MRSLARMFVAAVLCASLACVATESAPRSGTAAPAAAHAARVVLLSLDGLAATRHRELVRAGAYPDRDGLAAFEAGGYVVERALPAEPTLTAVSHTAIATGAFPAVNGIVSNTFHLPGTPVTQGISGFSAPWGAEPLWGAFLRQGKRVGVLLFPGCDAASASRTADFGMTYVNTPLSRAQEVTLAGGQFGAATLPPGLTSYSPARRAALSVPLAGEGLPAQASFAVTALDGSDDGRTDYDTLVVDGGADPGDGAIARVHVGEWFPLRLRVAHPDGGQRTLGAWCLLQAMAPDLSRVRIYRGAFSSLEAYPREFREALEAGAGFWPGPGDDRALAAAAAGKDGIALADYLAQTRRFSEFLNACARVAFARERFDLLMLYQPIVDEVEHQLLLVDPRQKDYTAAASARGEEAIRQSFLIADRAVGELARALDLGRDALVVVSDHGMAPVWESVHVNQLLQQAGLADAEQVDGRWRVKGGSRMVAYANGGVSHLYVNLKGRETAGVVDPQDRDTVIRSAALALAQLQADGENAVESMYRREELGPLGLDSPNSGDLVVFFNLGFVATSQIGAPGAPAHEPSDYFGQHGYRNTHPEVAAVWLARGRGVPARHVGQESLTEVASFVASLAGVDPPAQARPWSARGSAP
ncbi:MAG TPA: alkaline phosphatase family protein [Thermoanaerobaculaceae bacterium]|nr:alkaline phosphatase family protein [Thermoanaerobaculaceae bacterium]